MTIKKNPDIEEFFRVRAAVKLNDGYCPCSFIKNDDTKCMCKEFREQTEPGFCHCRLYYKEEN